MEVSRKVISCYRGVEYLVVEKDDDRDKLHMYVFSSYSDSIIPYTIKQKIAKIWRVLWKGEAFSDHVVLGEEKVKELRNWLSEAYGNET